MRDHADHFFARTILFFLLLAVPCSSAHSQTAGPSPTAAKDIALSAKKLTIPGVNNAGQINDVLFRGAQPSTKGFAELKKLGISIVVDLRSGHGEPQWEEKQLAPLGLRSVNIPVHGWSPPSDHAVVQFLQLIRDNPGQKIFVHCRYGDDRTGVMIAAYRIAMQNWTAKEALREMYSFGFHHRIYRNMESYVRNFPAAFASKSEFASLRTAAPPKQP